MRLDEGSEHIVYVADDRRNVIKLTQPGTFGDYYALIDGRVYQFRATPSHYLVRAVLVQKTFNFAPRPEGITPSGQILSRQQFVGGDLPTQEEVDEFPADAEFEPVKQSCWLWKKCDHANAAEYWVGDARSDNFVKTAHGIVPIDLRMWVVPV